MGAPAYPRRLAGPLSRALARAPVVLLVGARQVGKSTLVTSFAGDKPTQRRYVTLDDLGQLGAARADPAGFVGSLSGPVTIDEIQRAPDLLIAIKAAVDRDRTAGRFLLTGSADVLALPRVAETLTGRMEVLTLWPLAMSEVSGSPGGFVDAAFDGDLPDDAPGIERTSLAELLVRGGFPEALARDRGEDRDAWFRAYVETVIQREVAGLAQLDRLGDLPRGLQLLSARAAGLFNVADVGRALGVPHTSMRRYVALLEHTFLISLIPSWGASLSARAVKRPKLAFTDTGLLAYLQGLDETRLERDPNLVGALLENFVGGELTRQIGWSRLRPSLSHLRTSTGLEVDFVMEDRAGRVVGIEVKATATPRPADAKGLRALAERLGDRFVCGIVLHTGEQVIGLGPSLSAHPLSALWETPEPAKEATR